MKKIFDEEPLLTDDMWTVKIQVDADTMRGAFIQFNELMQRKYDMLPSDIKKNYTKNYIFHVGLRVLEQEYIKFMVER